MKKLDEFLNLIRRILSNEAIAIKIYIVWGLITLVVFGFMGFLPVSKIFLSNIDLLDDLYQNNLNLEKKIDELKVAKEKVELVGEDANILDKFLPDEFQAQNYLVDMSVIFGQSGYSLDSISFTNTSVNNVDEVTMNLRISGKGNLKDLVASLEESKKLNEIQSIRFSVGGREDSLHMTIRSFIMENK